MAIDQALHFVETCSAACKANALEHPAPGRDPQQVGLARPGAPDLARRLRAFHPTATVRVRGLRSAAMDTASQTEPSSGYEVLSSVTWPCGLVFYAEWSLSPTRLFCNWN